MTDRTISWNAPYTFSGKEKDVETGYGYFGARYYDSGLSIWLSVDPMSDKYPSMSPYNYCANNPVILVDPDGRDCYEIFINEKGKAQINVERNNDENNTYTFINANGDRIDLGTYEKNSKGMVKLDKSTEFYMQALYSQGNNYLDGDAAAGFLAAAYNFKQETGDKVKINQLMSADGVHSGKQKSIPCIDVQYPGINPNSQAETQFVNPDKINYQKCLKLVDFMRFYGFNDKGKNNFLTENGEKTYSFIPNTRHWKGHRNHIHIQGFNKKIINEL